MIRTKSAIIAIIALSALSLMIFIISQYVILGDYQKLEMNDIKLEINSTVIGFQYDMSTLDSTTKDYAYWDDTYDFVQMPPWDENSDYIQTNIIDITFVNQRLNYIIFLNDTDSYVYGRAYDLINETYIEVPSDLIDNLRPGSPLLRSDSYSGTNGVIMLESGPLMVSAFPIKDSNAVSEPVGTLVMGRYCDDNEIALLTSFTGKSIDIRSYDDALIPEDYRAVRSLINDKQPIIVNPLEGGQIAGYTIIEDIYGEPAIILRVEKDRTIVKHGMSMLNTYVAALLIAGVVISAFGVWVMDKTILSRISRIGEDIQKIGTLGNHSERVQVIGNDEVGKLALSINNTLENLDQSRNELFLSEQKFRSIVENVNDIVWEVDDKMIFTYISPNVKNVLGYAPEEMLGHKINDFMKAEDQISYLKDLSDTINNKDSRRLFEFEILDREGNPVDVEFGGTSVRNAQGDAIVYHGIARDIRARKQAELTLRKWADIFHSTKMAVAIVDPCNTDIEMANPAFLGLYGYREEEITGKSVTMLFEPVYAVGLREHLSSAETSGHHVFESMNVKSDSQPFPVSVDISVVKDDNGRVLYRIFNVQDITERRRAEEAVKVAYDELIKSNKALQTEIVERRKAEDQIRGSLKEKEVLLKEIHHRVKNNLQIISSLLNLQAGTINKENAIMAFKESQNRIKSMALIHEKLYQSENLSRIDFSEYASSLVAFLSRSYRINPHVSIEIDIIDISLDIDKAIPCGLIINELVSNSLKYAFPEGRAGTIRVKLSGDSNRYAMNVSDDGIGLPAGIDFRDTPSLGLQLVNTLVNQIEGSIELLPATGTMFRIEFSDSVNMQREPI